MTPKDTMRKASGLLDLIYLAQSINPSVPDMVSKIKFFAPDFRKISAVLI